MRRRDGAAEGGEMRKFGEMAEDEKGIFIEGGVGWWCNPWRLTAVKRFCCGLFNYG